MQTLNLSNVMNDYQFIDFFDNLTAESLKDLVSIIKDTHLQAFKAIPKYDFEHVEILALALGRFNVGRFRDYTTHYRTKLGKQVNSVPKYNLFDCLGDEQIANDLRDLLVGCARFVSHYFMSASTPREYLIFMCEFSYSLSGDGGFYICCNEQKRFTRTILDFILFTCILQRKHAEYFDRDNSDCYYDGVYYIYPKALENAKQDYLSIVFGEQLIKRGSPPCELLLKGT